MDKQVKIRVSVEADKATVDNQISSWKDLNKSIKDTRSELVRLQSEGKQGGKEWDTYANKLRELTKQKQIVQRQTKLTSQQLLTMSKDLTVVAFGIKDIVHSVSELGEGKKSVGELASSFGTLGIQILAVFPALSALNKSLQATGFITAGLISTLGTLLGGLTAITAEAYLMYNAFSKLDVVLQAWKDIFSGENLFDTWAKTTKELTGGIIDFTDEIEKSSDTQERFFDRGEDFIQPFNEKDLHKKEITVTPHNKTFKNTTVSVNDKPLIEDLNFLEEHRKKEKELNDEIEALSKLLFDVTLKDYERLAVVTELVKLQKELNELQETNTGKNATGKNLPRDEQREASRGTGKGGATGSDGESGGGERVVIRFEDIFAEVSSIANNTLITTLLGGADNFATALINGIGEAMSLANALASIIGLIGKVSSGGILSIFGFAEGGYTGDGSKYEPKGVVHAGEFVINKEQTKRFYPLLDLINGGSRNLSFSYASGGYVSGKTIAPNISVVVSTEFDRVKSYEVVYNGERMARERGTNRL